MRSLGDQTVEELGGRRSILHRQKQDHVKLDTLLERLPDTSGEERDELLNRADANLLLLCIEHSYEVDELPDLYPADLLREWKQAQLDEHEQAQRGWPLTDADVGRVLEASAQAFEDHHAGAVVGAVRARSGQLSLPAAPGRDLRPVQPPGAR